MRVASVLTCALAGCAYHPGSFSTLTQGFPGQRATIGCLDVSIDRRADLNAVTPVLEYQFGNRCDHPTPVDLAQVRVVGRNSLGAELDLVPYDPRNEIRPLSIDGRAWGKEAIAYPGIGQVEQICVDAASIAHGGAPRWLCFGSAPRLAVTP